MRREYRVSLFLFLVCFGCLRAEFLDWVHTPGVKAQRAQEVMRSFEPIIERALKEYRVPGIAIGLIIDGELVYAQGFGYRDVEKTSPITIETLFPIGSCTKAFTSFVVGTYVDEGVVYWDTPLVDVLPELHLWDDDATRHLSFRDALTHRSGLPRHDFLWYNSKMDREHLLQKLKHLEPVCRIKQRYVYNNLMYLAAGMALERVTHRKWEDLVTEKILQPLEMTNTNFSIVEMQKTHDFAFPYIEKGDQLRKMPFRDISLVGPAGSMNSNVEDLSHWIKM